MEFSFVPSSATLKSVNVPRTFAAILLFALPACAQDTSPGTIYIHGNILTGTGLLTTPVRVTAIAVTNSTIVATGSDADMLKLRGRHTQVVDLGGAFVMPGFNDAHTHIASAGQQKLTVDLDGTVSLTDMQSRIAAYVATAKPANGFKVPAGTTPGGPRRPFPPAPISTKSPPTIPPSSTDRRPYRRRQLEGSAGSRNRSRHAQPSGRQDRS